ncbi:hypothetical protein BDV93DRAFT_559880 [Ceratobasidium sp. AG-I]|nr:hypothetical protein BDV93DRAFT_559880 [Ceratobasidium sp. AG-I]
MPSDKGCAHCSPINRIPSELLALIFQIVVDYAYPLDIYDSMSYANPATKLAQVCSRWRQAALEAGSLWSCLVLSYQIQEDYDRMLATARMQLERTRGSPMDLFLFHEQSYVWDNPEFQCITDLIKPYMKQLRSLTVRLPRNEDIESLLEYCSSNGTAGSLSQLDIFGGNLSSPLFYQADSQTLEQLDEYLRSVRTLKLRAATFEWKCAVFELLDELSLCHLHTIWCPTLTQFANILSASPGLRRLRLKKMKIRDEMAPAILAPVKLQFLETLSLNKLGESSFCKVISVLSLDRRTSDITFNADFSSSIMRKALRRFASENNAVTFRLVGIRHRQPLHEILESLPAMANDPEAAKVKEWRHKLQRAFLAETTPSLEKMPGMDAVFTAIEQYNKMTAEYLFYSKIDKVMRHIIKLTNIPSDDQYHFRQRAQSLIIRWQQSVTTSEDCVAPTSTEAGSPNVGSAKASFVEPESVNLDKTKHEDAPVEPEASANSVQAIESGELDYTQVLSAE